MCAPLFLTKTVLHPSPLCRGRYKTDRTFLSRKGSAMMKNTPQNIFDLSRETALSLSSGTWTDFLRTAAWNFKYDFISQVLIYAQKPDATACASYDVWSSERFQRVPRKGTGIALIADAGDKMSIQYVFDISDTHVKKDALAPSVPIWKVTEAKESAVREALAREFLPEEEQTEALFNTSMASFCRFVASRIVQDRGADAVRDLWSVQDSCGLKGVTQARAENTLRFVLIESVSAILQHRCGYEPQINTLTESELQHFNSVEAISVLGTATQSLSRQALLEVARAVHQWDNEHKEEIQHENHISAGRGTPDSEPEHSAPAETKQVRADAQNISERAQAEPLYQSDTERRADPTPGEGRGEGPAAGESADAEAGRADAAAPSGEHSGQHSVSEQPFGTSGGTGAEGNYLRISEEDIQRALIIGPPMPGGKFRIYDAIENSTEPERLISVLQSEYGIDRQSFMLSSGLHGTLSWDTSGLKIEREGLREGNTLVLPWKAVSERLRGLVEADIYLDDTEKHNIQGWKDARRAILDRQRVGETARVFLSVYTPKNAREALKKDFEHIRAYVFENSDTARQALVGRLLELNVLGVIQNSPDAQREFKALCSDLSVQVEDGYTLPSATDAGILNPFPAEEEEDLPKTTVARELSEPVLTSSRDIRVGMVLHLPKASYLVSEMSDTHAVLEDISTPLFSQTVSFPDLDAILRSQNEDVVREVDALHTQNNAKNQDTRFAPEAVKEHHSTQDAADQLESAYSNNSIHTLRTAVSGLLRSQYGAYLYDLGAEELAAADDVAEFNVILDDFVGESAIYAAEEIPSQVERALRTPDYNGAAILVTAFAMRNSANAEVSRAGREAVLMLRELYQTDEETLLRAAATSGRSILPSVPEGDSERSEPVPAPVRQMTAAERNYAFLEGYAPAILDGTLDYMRFESEGFEPLYIERHGDFVSIAHTYELNGDLCYDPIVSFRLDVQNKQMLPLSFEQSIPPVCDNVYEDDIELTGKDPEMENSINDFLTLWFGNLNYQGHEPIRGIKFGREEDKEYSFAGGHMVLKQDAPQPEPVLPPIRFGYKDVIHLSTGGYEVVSVKDGMVEIVSLETAELFPPISVENLSELVRDNPDNLYIPGWKRRDLHLVYDREDQNLLARLLTHYDEWRTSDGVFIPGKFYENIQEQLTDIRISENESENREAILRVAYAIERFFPVPDHISARAKDKVALLKEADDFLDMYSYVMDVSSGVRFHEWRGGAEAALYEDLKNLCAYYSDRIPANIAEHLREDVQPDFYTAIPALELFLRGHEPEGLLKAQAEVGYEGILAAARLYADDRNALYPGRGKEEARPVALERNPEPLLDHPELHRVDQSRLARSDKVALTDLLYHFSTYRYTFDANTPGLNDRDAMRREEQFARIDEMVVSPSVEENLENIRKIKSIISRWFLPFEGIRTNILQEQEQLILAAEEVLLNPPEQEEEPAHTHAHDYAHDEDITEPESVGAEGEEESGETLWDYENETKNAGPAAPSSSYVRAQPLVDDLGRINHRTGDMHPHYGGPKARFRNNVAAIRLLKTLEEEERLATAKEQKILSRYVGWGGIDKAFDPTDETWQAEFSELKELLTDEEYRSAAASTSTAFYTPPVVIDAIYKGLEQLGIDSGNLLDAGCGIGAFFGQAPEQAKLYGIEIDKISGRIAQHLYQQANIAIEGFEETKLPDNFFNGMVGNVPFGNFGVFDQKYNKYNFQIHDYFFAKGLDKIRPGGVLALVTSTGTMDKQSEKFRRYLAERADLVGAIRLPNNTFKENAGTDIASDILFLRKRERPRVDIPDWVHTHTLRNGHRVNNYFISHRDMILGDVVEVSGQFGPQLTYTPREGEDLTDALSKALVHIRDEAHPVLDELDDPTENPLIAIPADPGVANYSFTVVNDEVYYREDEKMYRRDPGKTQSDRIKGMVELRDTAKSLIDAQLNDGTDVEIHRLQHLLSEQYDAFSKKFGLINSHGNELAFSDDSSYYLLCSLETFDKKGNYAGKADIFSKRTISARREVKHVDTPHEALLVSIGERGRVDLGYMERLSSIAREDLLDNLTGQIYENPERPGTYDLAATYLSGNIREKLRLAEAAEGREPGRYSANVRALQEAMPAPLGPGEISVRLGATWIPPDVIRDFMYEKFKTNSYNQQQRLVDVDYSPVLDLWAIKNKGFERFSVPATSTYGTSQMDAYTILEHTLNQKDVRIYKASDDDPDKRVLDAQETILAQEKQELIKNEFNEWIWSDPERSARLCSIYNEKFNSFRPPKYDGSILTFHGMSPTEELRQNQKDVIARILFSGNTQIAAAVGAGKTWMMTAAAMEGKYLGHCAKSMIVVPNHLVGQWTKDIYKLYPSANVLAVTKKDFEPKNRRKFCSRIATGDYDIVVIGHSQLEKIPLSAERQKGYIEEQIDEIVEGIRQLKEENNQHFTVKQMEGKKRSLERNLKKLTESKKRDDVVTFEELGVDRLFIDESDEFKNLYLHTKMQNVAGLAQTDAQKASDLFLKCRYMDELTGCKGNIHATGTPLSNTMAEIYTAQRYLQYDTLKELGLHHFDAWLSNFGEAKPVLELAPEGTGYRMRNRLTNFYNLPELMGIYRQVAEIQTQDMLDIPLPNAHYITISVPASEHQKAMVQRLAERAEAIRNGSIRSEEDNMLCVVNDGRKLALDQRLLDPDLPDDPESKVNAAADTVYEQWLAGKEEKLTQLVFCDMSTPKADEFNVYDALRDKLAEKGIPRDEIRFIHEANSEAQKDTLFSQVREGTVRVLIGSTGKMGTGTNVQDLLVAGHDLDCPWRPRDLTQRNGRVIRFGNTNADVYIYRYVTEGTFDAYMYQLLESKQRLISQIFTSESPARQVEDVDQMTLSFAEIKGIASDNPLIKEKVELQLDISKLEMIRARHLRNQASIADLVFNALPSKIKNETSLLTRLSKDAETLKEAPSRTSDGKYIPIPVNGFEFEAAADSGSALLKALDELPADGEQHIICQYRGFDLVGANVAEGNLVSTSLYAKGAATYPISLGDKAIGVVIRVNNVLDNIPARVDGCRERISETEKSLADYRGEVGKPFAREEELRQKHARMKELDAQLNMDLRSGPQQNKEEDVIISDEPVSLVDKIQNAQERAATSPSHTPGQEFHERY